MRMIQMMFRYNPRNHCWPAIRKSIIAITIYTLLLSVIETFIVYEINKAFEVSEDTEKESRKMFNQAFQDSVSRINPIVGNHLFQRILPQARDYDNYCINASFSSFSQKYDYAGIEAIFSPAENDRKPRWYDELLKYASCIVLYILVLIFGFGTCKTEDC